MRAVTITKLPITRRKAITMAITSIIVSALTLPTLFLMITVFILPGIALKIGVSTLIQTRRNPALSFGVKALAFSAVIIAIGTFVGSLYLINTGYRA